MATVYIENENRTEGHIRLTNNSGADLAQYEFGVLGNIAFVADEAIADDAVGSVHDEDGIILQADSFVALEGTFATPNQAVYWDPVSGNFSDTSTVGYYNVGQLVNVLNANGVIRFTKRRWVEEITS